MAYDGNHCQDQSVFSDINLAALSIIKLTACSGNGTVMKYKIMSLRSCQMFDEETVNIDNKSTARTL